MVWVSTENNCQNLNGYEKSDAPTSIAFFVFVVVMCFIENYALFSFFLEETSCQAFRIHGVDESVWHLIFNGSHH